jgi:hypothetical protein
MNTESLNADDLRMLLTEVAEELRRNRAHGEIYIVGGSAVALSGLAMTRTTSDLDAQIIKGHGAVISAAHAVARKHGLPGSWINEQASSFIPMTPDSGAREVFYHENLRVRAASPRVLLAMKLIAGRDQDIDDTIALMTKLDVTAEAAIGIVESLYGPDAVTEDVVDNAQIAEGLKKDHDIESPLTDD